MKKRHVNVASAAHVSVVQRKSVTSKHNLIPPLLGAVFLKKEINNAKVL